ncbi:hypothetical protein MRX96_022877 [Rhipicephalus microplus]
MPLTNWLFSVGRRSSEALDAEPPPPSAVKGVAAAGQRMANGRVASGTPDACPDAHVKICIDVSEPGTATPKNQDAVQFFPTPSAGLRSRQFTLWSNAESRSARRPTAALRPTTRRQVAARRRRATTCPCTAPPKEELGPGGGAGLSEAKASFMRNQLEALFQPSDNKLAMKLFGSKKALMKERIRQKAAGHWIIHPCSNFRFYWDLCMLLLLVANLIVLPVAISFFNDDLSIRWIAFNCLSDTIFLLDIVVNFRTGIMHQDNSEQVILDPKLIAHHYIRTWFFLDLISSIPPGLHIPHLHSGLQRQLPAVARRSRSANPALRQDAQPTKATQAVEARPIRQPMGRGLRKWPFAISLS